MKLVILSLILCVLLLGAAPADKQPLQVTFEEPNVRHFYIFNLDGGMWSVYAEPASVETYLGATPRPTSGVLTFLVSGTGTLRLHQGRCE